MKPIADFSYIYYQSEFRFSDFMSSHATNHFSYLPMLLIDS